MNSLGIWTIVMIIYQSATCLIISWLTLSCRLAPDSNELHEVTLMKLLYLYDPEACGRIHFYNFTVRREEDTLFSTIMWPLQNPVASKFRRSVALTEFPCCLPRLEIFLCVSLVHFDKISRPSMTATRYVADESRQTKIAMRVWLLLHMIWLALSILNVTHGRRSCGFYAILLPFTLTGFAMLVTDIVFMAMFIQNVAETDTEISILDYINRGGKNLRWIIKVYPWQTLHDLRHSTLEDTTWISLLFAFASCRGVVQWILNFWLVQDNYFASLETYLFRGRPQNPKPYQHRDMMKELLGLYQFSSVTTAFDTDTYHQLNLMLVC